MSKAESLDPTALVGQWTFDRTVDDRREGRTVEARGTADFVATDAGRIDWHEEGTLLLEAGPVRIAVHRVLRREPSGSWAVDFADGRPFHPWLPGEEVSHDCPPDDYRGRIDGTDAGVQTSWTMRWTSVGPEKDYTIDTAYRRL
ncbi:hypothetical protein AX769_02780 [Frondihabitans sp. PAMC 28766]|uniref:DUF6314 family protein n=1 Tax=Frondihabitans sp. PAMC 28766 TaxID=1795630 RepID=UPI00078E649D|nr:DUF6314 family protein [Frondihabitans sp. PAMC 28766]AMM19252.1 hypothetical protein AX769_02780 [Frondihabitans sp. PAMC 28766]